MAPAAAGPAAAKVRAVRNSNKHKRLFVPGESGGLQDGTKLLYKSTASGEGPTLLEGVAIINPNGACGIMCGCCQKIVSCSAFEAHAGRGQRRAPYDFIFTPEGINLRRMAERLSPLPEEDAAGGGGGATTLTFSYGARRAYYGTRGRGRGRGGAGRWEGYEEDELPLEPELITDPTGTGAGCVLCKASDFLRGGFGDRTIMICDTCEREFHVDCLRGAGRCDLKELPAGDWYCSCECAVLRDQIDIWVSQADVPLGATHSLQAIRGKDGSIGTSKKLGTALDLLQGSFDPIMDAGNSVDLLPLIVYARAYREWDFSNMMTLLLRHKGRAVCVAVLRVFGPQLAELPLVATRPDARRQGHAKVLVSALEALLSRMGVRCLALPAAHEAEKTWVEGFHFEYMPEKQQEQVKRELRMLIFPGTQLLRKNLEPRGAAAEAISRAAGELLIAEAAQRDACPSPEPPASPAAAAAAAGAAGATAAADNAEAAAAVGAGETAAANGDARAAGEVVGGAAGEAAGEAAVVPPATSGTAAEGGDALATAANVDAASPPVLGEGGPSTAGAAEAAAAADVDALQTPPADAMTAGEAEATAGAAAETAGPTAVPAEAMEVDAAADTTAEAAAAVVDAGAEQPAGAEPPAAPVASSLGPAAAAEAPQVDEPASLQAEPPVRAAELGLSDAMQVDSRSGSDLATPSGQREEGPQLQLVSEQQQQQQQQQQEQQHEEPRDQPQEEQAHGQALQQQEQQQQQQQQHQQQQQQPEGLEATGELPSPQAAPAVPQGAQTAGPLPAAGGAAAGGAGGCDDARI
ncbi:hypothetical protein MNEG_14670 [Monoraphidium neglectum]|uniref:N-acetyltransferase domain-containing protein n=1 Tax=Monoraphidium neglectum TaxID=145388 RepID=A0A0D2IZL6_9CHLO|nr:hypothetical protein MNEG_14670 [Monoraphidium neglectum]KIY93292.1 hypothetical protein MNEG_14670 [Monoraphidium neglectum]|eukprot:XP_013892312.1 hypothetical protein MNEG_14670 [Monoraphidium neglectum]